MNATQRSKGRSHKFAAFFASAVLLGSVAEQSFAVSCGPGAHWVDGCAAGTDVLGTTSGSLSVNFIGLGVFTIPVVGTGGVIARSAPTDTLDVLDPGHLNQINTEFVSGVFNNAVPLPGIGNISVMIGAGAGVATPTYGGIIENADPSLATSYFDAFFLVNSALGTFHNNDPLRLTATTGSWLPGGGIFYGLDSSATSVGIYNDANLLVGFIANPTGTGGFNVTPVPIPPALYLFSAGLFGLWSVARRKMASLQL